ncbi:MAG: hypothetical protein BJBARM5_1065 [Candidatus Parvarchaeum acidophilus ARMAN-5]|uniref:Uncharacterized protein n=1 Tax=Candidatus Parvarchaeum acidophilus ARMAN-5 TaxID=662762 RepID=D6GX41_PARA5|nr:MAG: hypothetical protein BJBARM5_1065 [Candidatus Parvarchaeum acidophilus ARMAN-5]
MEKYFIVGVVIAVIVVSVIILLFGVGRNNNIIFPSSQSTYSSANSSLQQIIYNDILNLRPYQTSIPLGKIILYSANYTLSTDAVLSNGTAENSSETAAGIISLLRGKNGNSEADSNFTITKPLYGTSYSLNSSSYMFSIGNDTYTCLISAINDGAASCTSLNESMKSIVNLLSSGLKINRLSVLRNYSTIYEGYPCLFTEESFSILINGSNSSLIGTNANESLSGTVTSCQSTQYNIPILNSLAASINVNSEYGNISLNSKSFINYNMSIKRISNFNGEITNSSLPK